MTSSTGTRQSIQDYGCLLRGTPNLLSTKSKGDVETRGRQTKGHGLHDSTGGKCPAWHTLALRGRDPTPSVCAQTRPILKSPLHCTDFSPTSQPLSTPCHPLIAFAPQLCFQRAAGQVPSSTKSAPAVEDVTAITRFLLITCTNRALPVTRANASLVHSNVLLRSATSLCSEATAAAPLLFSPLPI